jgi:hypothetical protein
VDKIGIPHKSKPEKIFLLESLIVGFPVGILLTGFVLRSSIHLYNQEVIENHDIAESRNRV